MNAGHEADYADFYGREFGRIVAAIRGRAGPDAEDVAQEAFLVAARRWDEVAVLDLPVAWVRRVAIRIAGRRGMRDRMRVELEAGVTPGEGATDGDRDLDLDLAAALLDLPNRHAAAVFLHHLEDRPVGEVADRLGCSVPAAKVLLLRARRLLAERLTGLTGRWLSDQTWSADAIAGHLRAIGAGEFLGPVLEEDLEGRGGRWELSIVDGSYTLFRDDGKRLDHGVSRVGSHRIELRPILNTGRAAYRPVVDGDRLHLRLVDTTIPPTLGAPDEVWVSLFLESGPFVRIGRPPSRAV